MKKKTIPILLFVLLLTSLFWGFHNGQKFKECLQANRELIHELKKAAGHQSRTDTRFLREGDRFTESITLTLVDGQEWILQPGVVTLLIFISTTCPVCLETALSLFSELSPFQQQGLQIISVSRDPAKGLAGIVSQRNWPTPVVHDRQGQLYRLLRVSGEPFLVLIDRGLIRLKVEALALERRRPELPGLIAESLSSR